MHIEVNGQPIPAEPGESILTALTRAGIKVPTLCHMEGLPPSGACRICVVELQGRGLVPSCAFPVGEGMQIQTHSPRVMRARKTIVELLLANHPDDCLYCSRNGECQLQALAYETGVRKRRYTGPRNELDLDISSPSIVRDPNKCILCGKCVRTCEEIQGVAAIDFVGRGSSTRIDTACEEGLNVSSCINCGQCIMACPTGALAEQSHLKEVLAALNDPERFVVVQHAPAISVSLAEEFGLKSGTEICEKMTTALRMMGFDRVFETSFSADLTIMEEASELIERIRNGGKLPMLTSCSPGWIKFVEEFYPDLIDHLSTCKSPQQMLGAVIKSYFAQREGLDPERIFSVSVMPCTAKKFEAERPEMAREGRPDIDAVLTTREFALMLRMRGLELEQLPPSAADTPFGERSSAGKIFGASGGVMEAAARTALKQLRGTDGIKEAHLEFDGASLGVAVVNGIGHARTLLDQIREGRSDLHFIEVMTCPGGCIAGGGQPLASDPEAVRARMRRLYQIDRDAQLRVSHQNPEIQRIYQDFLDQPLSERSHQLLHTHYHPRSSLK